MWIFTLTTKNGEKEIIQLRVAMGKNLKMVSWKRINSVRSVGARFDGVPRQMISTLILSYVKEFPFRDRHLQVRGRGSAHFVATLGISYIYPFPHNSRMANLRFFRWFGTELAKRVHKIENDWWIKLNDVVEWTQLCTSPTTWPHTYFVQKHNLQFKDGKKFILFSIQLISLSCESLFTCHECTHERSYLCDSAWMRGAILIFHIPLVCHGTHALQWR